ncbi:hypothetical protein [Kitasatospora cineracea]|uniref:aromatic-ring hydroxylase C-terminal domain-containing protein n=1 Tax=Kitasatospora cineracea TaxID=88074 RepID=UPI0031345495
MAGAPAAGWADRVTTVSGEPEPGSALDGAGTVLVRPDGHVAWVGPEDDGLRAALHRWFGPAR